MMNMKMSALSFAASCLAVTLGFSQVASTPAGGSATNQTKGTQPEPTTTQSEAQPIKPANLGSTKNVHQAGTLFFSGQFEPNDIATIQGKEITRVISLRTEGEIDWDEEAALKTSGIELVKVPFQQPESLTDEVFDEIRELLADKSQPTLFHCGSANRVGGVWLPYRVLDEGVPLETALQEAKTIGLKTPFVEKKAIDYIKKEQAKTKD